MTSDAGGMTRALWRGDGLGLQKQASKEPERLKCSQKPLDPTYRDPKYNRGYTLCLYKFIGSRCLIEVESHNVWPILSGFFHSA